MRRLLILALVGMLPLAVSHGNAGTVAAVQYTPQIFLLPPTGFTGTPSSNAKLMCGWHDNCNNEFSDVSDIGLDWQNVGSSRQIWVRLLGYISGGPNSSTWVGRAQALTQDFPCYRVKTNVYRVNWDRVGSIIQNHSQYGGAYWKIYASANQGVTNAAVTGSYIPHSEDNCPSSYDHVMQWYESGPFDTVWNKNFGGSGDMPHESECFHCGTQYAPWNVYEYYFRFTTSP